MHQGTAWGGGVLKRHGLPHAVALVPYALPPVS